MTSLFFFRNVVFEFHAMFIPQLVVHYVECKLILFLCCLDDTVRHLGSLGRVET